MWLARLAVQVAEATLFSYLYFWLLSMDAAVTDSHAARLFGVTMIVAAPLALAVGNWTDRRNRPIFPLQVCALASCAGLIIMAMAKDLSGALPGYYLFGVASAVFLALHASQTLRFLPRTDRRGRDLGVFNLANTAPSLVMPWLVFALVPHFGFGALLYCLAILSAAAAVVLATLSASR
jgi:MFS family permease